MCYSVVYMTETFSRGHLYSCGPHNDLTHINTIYEVPLHVVGNQFY